MQIDVMNIGFMIISFFLAFSIPFELFLFAYVVLGPLHYLTEINWLNKRNFFIDDRKWTGLFIFLCLLISIPPLLTLPIVSFIKPGPFLNKVLGLISFSFNQIVLFMFLFAIGLVFIDKRKHLFLYVLGCIAAAFFLKTYVSFYVIAMGIFLPTIIHVYLFTLLFMIQGALQKMSWHGIAGVIFLILGPLIIFNSNINPSDYIVSGYARTSYLTSKVSILGSYMARLLHLSQSDNFQEFSAIGIKIQIFIAFCYTYHYLNWFSKTSVIGWGKAMTKRKFALAIAIWFGSILLYLYDYKTGFIVLFFLSIVHVVLEFPLNIRSVKGIASKLIFQKKS